MQSIWRSLFSGSTPSADVSKLIAPLQSTLELLEQSPQQRAVHQPELAQQLLELSLPAWQVSTLLSEHNDFCYRQAIDQALEQMQAQGWGKPPVRFCVIVMGSGGRHESLLHPDQDNALILEDYPPEHHAEIDTWFLHFAERFTTTLDQSGIPFCRGDVMASRPLWRKPISEWLEQMRLWMSTRRVKLVQMCNILFDFTPVYGEADLAEQLRQSIFARREEAGLFLHEMAELFDEAPVALDRFDRLQGDGREAPHQDAINLKRQGLLPLTGALRLLALLKGCEAVSSRERLYWFNAEGHVSENAYWCLNGAFERLQTRLLNTQLEKWRQGSMPDNWIDLRELCDGEKRELQADLQQIRGFQKRVKGI